MVACLVCFAPGIWGQQKATRLVPRYATVGQPDQAEGRAILEEFRQMGIPGDYFFAFSLEVLPRRGPGYNIPGQLWGSRTPEGPISRVRLFPLNDVPEERLLVQNGRNAQAWRVRPSMDAAAEPKPLVTVALFEPLAATQVTPFDLQMPFLFWDDFAYEGVNRVRGRNAHTFLLYPPAEFTADDVALGGVRVYLDLQFNAMIQAEQLAPNGGVSKTMTVIDLKRVGDQWIVKSIDMRDAHTRDKTRFRVTAVGMDLNFTPALFEPAMLGQDVQPPPRGQLQSVD